MQGLVCVVQNILRKHGGLDLILWLAKHPAYIEM